MNSEPEHLDPALSFETMPPPNAQTPQHILPNNNPYPPDRIQVWVDRQHFIHTRNALNNAFMSLSSAIDRAVKAYADHTDAVINNDHTLDVSGLLMPFNQITQFAQQLNPAYFTQFAPNAPVTPMDGGAPTTGKSKKKRAYKARDKDAPKRPLTAYFRFLKEQRPVISQEISETPGAAGGKAGDISKIATERWHALTEAERNPYKLAYQQELEAYETDTKAYKERVAAGLATPAVAGGAEDAEGEDEEMDSPTAGPAHVVAKADDDEDDDSDVSTSSGDSSDDDDEDDSDAEVIVPPKASTPPAKKAAAKAKKAVTAAADPVPAPQIFTSLNPTGLAPTAVAASQKRKASEDEELPKKKRGRPTKAEQEAAAAASQLVAEDPVESKKEKKERKKKRKSEAAAAAAA